ncbi:hypothetical protein BEP19_03725 [Ammoniphilus oxalaticus]|uniref:Uncharacterized protein n=1 Tax=Ammoniphilus oxalaticus TaxID=66863 RepID=A0A419SLR2_9BACL|nr:hypothetical protein BEP19_03725 [Ammoniphilus oxalaticus]
MGQLFSCFQEGILGTDGGWDSTLKDEQKRNNKNLNPHTLGYDKVSHNSHEKSKSKGVHLSYGGHIVYIYNNLNCRT